MKIAELTVSEKASTKGPVIKVIGELDLTTVSQLREQLLGHADDPGGGGVIVDLTDVEFIDSAGLALLVEARKRMSVDSRTLFLVITPGKQPERVLRLVKFDTIMKLVYHFDDIVLD
jgi:anti-sigma B factor antagonist